MEAAHPDRVDEPLVIDEHSLRLVLDGRWAAVRDEVRRELKRPELRPRYGTPTDEHRALVYESAVELGRTPYPKLGFPVRYGGGGDTGAFVTSFQALAFGDLSLLVKVGVQWGLFGGALFHLGTESHHERYLPPMMSFELPGCFAMTETGHGSDVQSLRTTATFDEQTGEFVIHTPDDDARKDYIGNAARDGRVAVVFAQLITKGEHHGVHAFVVPLRSDGRLLPGVAVEDCGHKAGLNGVDNGRISFDHVRVSREALLDRHGQVGADGKYSSTIENRTRRFFTMIGTLVQGRVSVSGAAVSAAETALTVAVRYARERRQFSPPDSDDEVTLLDYRAHQRRLLPLVATTYALHFAQNDLVQMLHEAFSTDDYPDRDKRRLESLAAGIKVMTTWHATNTIQTARESCGGAGYLSENLLAVLRADTDVFTTFEGDNIVLLQLVAKGLLTDYREEFGGLDALGTLRFVADQVLDRVVERTAPARNLIQALIDAVPGREEETDVRDRGYHLELFEWRESHVLEGLARRLRAGLKGGGSAFDVFNEAQDHVLLAARAHIERVVLESAVGAIADCKEESLRALLNKVCDLHALATIERERGWFFEHGRLSAPRSKAIIAAVNDLCSELSPHARLLVDAFGVPDEVLPPIALGAEQRRQDGKAQPTADESVAGFAPPPA
jgi:acyl-CoA oxidase